MRFPIPLVIDLPDDQLAAWADAAKVSLPRTGGEIRAKDAVEVMRPWVRAAVAGYFEALGVRADISVKR